MANVNGTLTVMAPPPGYVVDFSNPQRHYQNQIYTAMIVENTLALLFLIQRLFTRMHVMKLFQIEDGAALGAWIMSVATQATLLVGWLQGVMGVHAWEISLNDYEFFTRLMFAVPLTYTICTACAKGALCLFYGRLSPDVMFQIAVKATLALIIVGYSGVFFSSMFSCNPISASWSALPPDDAQCLNRPALFIGTAILSIVTDIILLTLPVPMIWKLQMPLKQKFGLTAMFIIGSLTIVTSIIRLQVLLSAMKTSDQSWVIGEGALWIIIECNLLVICCCQPTLRLFFKHIAPTLIGERTKRPTYEQSNGRRLRTWGTMTTRRRQRLDTLTGTLVDSEEADNVPLELRGDLKAVCKRETKIESCKGKCDESEEAILFERSLEITYGAATSTHSQQSR